MPGRAPLERGFTLIETLIAMALLAFIVADVGMVSVYASRSGLQARRITEAVGLAENAIEHVRGADFNRIRLVDNTVADCLTGTRTAVSCGDPSARIVRECFTASLVQVSCGGSETVFTRERDVTTPGGVALDAALSAQVDVLLTWTDPRGGAQEYRLASIISKY